MIGRLRKPVDTFAPALGRAYRVIRDSAARSRSLTTAFGFTLAGDPTMADEAWEVDQLGFFLDNLRSHDAVVDIGANIGFYTCLAGTHGKPVVSVEPSRRNQEFLYRNILENDLCNIEILPVALSGDVGLSRLYGFGGISSLVPGWAQSSKATSYAVPVTTLDRVTVGRFTGARLFIKLDVEGFEAEVLHGAPLTLRRVPRPTWLVEILLRDEVIPGVGTNRRFYETFALFWNEGYTCMKADGERTSVSRADVERWVENNRVDSGTTDFIFRCV